MISLVAQWTGREIRALRLAHRMSVRAFAENLGVSDRMASKWEAGGEAIQPRVENQAELDRSLAMAGPEVQARFSRLVGDSHAIHINAVALTARTRLALHHPIDDRLMVLIEPGPYEPTKGGPAVWLPGFCIDVRPVTCAEFERFAHITGHRIPTPWRSGDTIAVVPWDHSQAYASWASKALPTALQLARGAGGEEGMLKPDDLAEWCTGDLTRPMLHRRSGSPTGRLGGFRTVAPADELLALLAM